MDSNRLNQAKGMRAGGPKRATGLNQIMRQSRVGNDRIDCRVMKRWPSNSRIDELMKRWSSDHQLMEIVTSLAM